MFRATVLCGAVVLLGVIGCQENNEVVEVQQPRLTLTVSNLPRLGPGEGHYQLWAKFVIFDRSDAPQHDSAAVSLGEFNVSSDGATVVGTDGNPVHLAIPANQNPQLIDVVIITVQSADSAASKSADEEPGPAFLAGRVQGDASTGTADLDASHVDALGSAFSSTSGAFAITAPTSPSDSSSGVWFVDKQGSAVSAGLRNLPPIPDEWVYEGWVRLDVPAQGGGTVQYLSTGRFLRGDSADFDGAGPGKGPGVGYNFPGQDFINPIPPGLPARPDLRFCSFMVTIEPVPDNSPQPFPLRLFATPIPQAPLPQGQTVLMNNVSSSSFPHARLKIVRSGY